MNSFSSREYRRFKTWQLVIFWLGVLFFIHPVYWLVRLIIYLVVKDRPLKERVDFYTRQTYVFGWIFAIMFGIVVIVMSTILILVFAAGISILPWLAIPALQ